LGTLAHDFTGQALFVFTVLFLGFTSGNRFFALHLLPDFVDSGEDTPRPGRFYFCRARIFISGNFSLSYSVQ